jgi:hypothetical protein
MVKKYGDFTGNFPLTEGEQQGITINDDETKDLGAKGSRCLVVG